MYVNMSKESDLVNFWLYRISLLLARPLGS
jgi:hypothetical protein